MNPRENDLKDRHNIDFDVLLLAKITLIQMYILSGYI